MKTQFTAMPKLYIGLDIHKKSWSVHLRTDISDHKTITMPSHPEVLYDYVFKNFNDHDIHLVYEIGCCGFSAGRYFLQQGWNVTIVNPADVPRMDKQQYQKTDIHDCKNLAKQLKACQLQGIYIPDEKQDQLKSLLRQRAEITRSLRSSKNQIKSLLLYHGIEVPLQYDNPNWTKEFIQWIESIQWIQSTGKLAINSKLRIYKLLHQEHLQVANELRSYCRQQYKKDYYLLKSIPGIGGYLSAAVLAEVGDLRRFRNEKQFASYIGLIPMMKNSGATEKIIGVTPRCRALLRSYIIESAWVAYRLDPHMQAYYRKHIGKNPKSIIVKIARKLLNRMLSVIKTETTYQTNYKAQKNNEEKNITQKKKIHKSRLQNMGRD
jgi:transposase